MNADTASPTPLPRQGGDRLRRLRAFCHTARLRSFTRAAEYLFSSQPSISQQVRALEEEFAVLLLDRDGPGLSLTPAGRKLYQLALPVVAGIDRLPDLFADLHHGSLSGELRIAAGESVAEFVLPDHVKRFHALYPAVEVNVRTGSGSERLGWLRDYEVDVVFSATDSPPRDLEFRFLFASVHTLITPEDHPLAGRQSVTLEEVASYPIIALPRGTPLRRLRDLFARMRGVTIDVAVEVGGWQAVKRYVEAGAGISVVPDVCLAEQDRLAKIPMTELLPTRPYGILIRRDEILSLASRRFIRLVDPSFPEEA